jgi:bifunctional ADP-heptose synthase (sugar kinase/adenylyltransferase)
MLTDSLVESILGRLPALCVGVLGDLFLDRYLDLNASLTEPSLETGLDAYQVVGVRSCPGAAGTVINNLAGLGVGRICPLGFVGEDGEGFELKQALGTLRGVDDRWLSSVSERRTPTYTKPLLHELGRPPRELNRLDIKNRSPLPADLEEVLLNALEEAWNEVVAWVVLDQVSEADCGVFTGWMRQHLAAKAEADPDMFVLADSRERIDAFHSVCLKPNERECRRATGSEDTTAAAVELSRRAGRPVFCTRGAAGILLADARSESPQLQTIPAYPVSGPIDIVGAGDSTSAGIVCAVAAGASLAEAAAFGNLVASITIQQLGTTGFATPEQVRQRWRQVSHSR